MFGPNFTHAKKDLEEKSYELISLIGEGSFGSIYKIIHINNKMEFAAKQINKKENEQVWSYIESEIKIMKILSSSQDINPNIILLNETFETDNYLYMILELGDLDLERLWHEFQQKIPEDIVIEIIYQLLNGFYYLHSNFIIHRDIKLENIIIVYPEKNYKSKSPREKALQATYKIADFGLSKQISKDKLNATYLGSPYTMAPEIQREEAYTHSVDIYSLGIIIYQMLEGDFPFIETIDTSMIDIIQKQDIQFKQEVSPELQEMIKQMLKSKPKERITWDEIRRHPALKQEKFVKFENILLDDIVDNFYKSRKDSLQRSIDLMGQQQQQDEVTIFSKLNLFQSIGKNNSIIMEVAQTQPQDQVQIIDQQQKAKFHLGKLNNYQILQDFIQKLNEMVKYFHQSSIEKEINSLVDIAEQLHKNELQKLEEEKISLPQKFKNFFSPNNKIFLDIKQNISLMKDQFSQICKNPKIFAEKFEMLQLNFKKTYLNELNKEKQFQEILLRIYKQLKFVQSQQNDQQLKIELLKLEIKLIKSWEALKDNKKILQLSSLHYYEMLIIPEINEQLQKEFITELKQIVEFPV